MVLFYVSFQLRLRAAPHYSLAISKCTVKSKRQGLKQPERTLLQAFNQHISYLLYACSTTHITIFISR